MIMRTILILAFFCSAVNASIVNKCAYYEPPLNGILVCDGWLGSKFCNVQCQDNMEFAQRPASLYICGSRGDWVQVPHGFTIPWPDCSERYIPGTPRLGMKSQYYDATDNTQLQIKRNFLKILKTSIFGGAGACNSAACKVENVKVFRRLDFRCPFKKHQIIYTSRRRNYGKLNLPVRPNSNVIISSSPNSGQYDNVRLFKLQDRNALPYVVKYKEVDRAGKEKECQFKLEVRDNEPPWVRSCPADIIITSTKAVSVHWITPEFEDNSRRSLVIYGCQQPGVFAVGVHSVSYSAEDQWGNKAYCKFSIKIKANNCPFYDPPLNGALVCDGWYNKFCTVQCQNNREFSRKPARLYICSSTGKWVALPQEATMPWPDCSERYIPGATRLGLRYQYYDVIDKTQRNFLAILRASIFGRAGACNTDSCKVENVLVYQGRKDSQLG